MMRWLDYWEPTTLVGGVLQSLGTGSATSPVACACQVESGDVSYVEAGLILWDAELRFDGAG